MYIYMSNFSYNHLCINVVQVKFFYELYLNISNFPVNKLIFMKFFHTYKYGALPINNNKLLIYIKMLQIDTDVYCCKIK